jgi:biopolymer transport protein ExbD
VIARVDGRLVLPAELARLAADAKARDPQAKAVIRATEKTSHGAVVGAMDILRSSGVSRIALAVKKP